jgi:hypothetical protein
MILLEDIKKNEYVSVLIETANRQLEVAGFTEHGFSSC